MCRLLGYLGPTIQLEKILCKPQHSLIVQSYRPQEMAEALLNADGYGIGWYHPTQSYEPFTYRNVLPIWNDLNLESLGRYIESDRILAYVRSATPGQGVTLANCQPFRHGNLLFTHNGYIQEFRQTLYRPMRNQLSDAIYQSIDGNTDSEHLFALFLNQLGELSRDQAPLDQALSKTFEQLKHLAEPDQIRILANVIVTDGQEMVASRWTHAGNAPTLYWLQNPPEFPNAVILASETLFPGDWQLCPEQTLIHVKPDGSVHFQPLP
ncbi:MAG: ergothioneine biosynthesis protein EgtC [Microcoleaceae cyanobacterium]